MIAPVLVTAFGPFGGRSENASSLVLKELRKVRPGIRTRILPVDAVIAPSRLKQAIRSLRPSALVMLGEASGSTGIRLETTAWNLRDFRIPDIAGRKQIGVPVFKGAADSLPSTLPLQAIHDRLIALGHEVSLSDDPGRYLCNQVFFTALAFMKTNAPRTPTGFIHLPLETVCPTDFAVRAVREVIQLVSQEKLATVGKI